MQNKEQKYHAYTARKRRRSVWNQLVRALACLVVFVTTYALILPAITVSHEVICGYEEHTHSDDCYLVLNCGQEESETHTHTDDCYILGSEPVCGLTAHTHTDDCYAATENWLTNLGIMLLGTDDTSETTNDLQKNTTVKHTSNAVYDPQNKCFDIDLRLDFNLTRKQIEDANLSFTYTLPTNVTIPDNLLNTVNYGKDTGSAIAFEYRFLKNDDGTYYIDIQFLSSYVGSMPDDSTGADVYIQFEGIVSEDAWKDEGGIDLTYKDGTVISIGSATFPDVSETPNYDIGVSKDYSYDDATGVMTYTIKVESQKGTPDSIILQDVLQKNDVAVDLAGTSATVTKYTVKWPENDSQNKTTTKVASNKTV